MSFREFKCPHCGSNGKIRIFSKKTFECNCCYYTITQDIINKNRIFYVIKFVECFVLYLALYYFINEIKIAKVLSFAVSCLIYLVLSFIINSVVNIFIIRKYIK